MLNSSHCRSTCYPTFPKDLANAIVRVGSPHLAEPVRGDCADPSVKAGDGICCHVTQTRVEQKGNVPHEGTSQVEQKGNVPHEDKQASFNSSMISTCRGCVEL
eukprot:4898891-Amphidinium_carterae.2